MATFPKRTLVVRQPSDSYMSYAVRRTEEGASETFIASSPIVITAGLAVEAADPVAATDGVWGIALSAGQNLASPTVLMDYIPVVDGIEFYANFLNTAGTTNNTLATADLDTANPYEVQKNSVGGGSGTDVIWHVADASGTDAAQMINFHTDVQLPDTVSSGGRAADGDINARVTFVFIDATRAYN